MLRRMALGGFAVFAFISAGCARPGTGSLFPKDETYAYESLRTLGYAPAGAADVNEVLRAATGIREGDGESWYGAWSALAGRTVATAESLNGDPRGRGRALLRASNYFRTAEFLMPPEDPRKAEAYGKCREAFYGGLDSLGIPYELGSAAFGEASLETLFFPPRSGSSFSTTLVCMVNGYDSIKEEAYFALGQEALERGCAFLSYDGPGQGAAIRLDGLPMTADWAPVNEAVLDAVLAEHPGIDRVVLVGFSLGSILATKAAAEDPRIDFLVHYDVFHDFAEAVGDGMPPSFRDRIFADGPLRRGTAGLLETSMRFSSEIDWALRHGAWILGKGDDYAGVLRAYRDFEIESAAPLVACPVLLFAGEDDHFVPIRLAEDSAAAFTASCDVKVIRYPSESGGGEHCQAGALTLWTADLFQWLSEREGSGTGLTSSGPCPNGGDR